MKQLLLLIATFPAIVLGQEVMSAQPEKLVSINGTIDEMLRVINGEVGKQRNWEAFKNIFLESCSFTVYYGDPETPFETASIDEMIEFMQDDYYNSGYKEEVLKRRIKEFNGIAQVFEVVLHTEPDGNQVKGLNSYHLVQGKDRWYITNVIWTAESKDTKIPPTFLKD
jgi:hypothetical protein